jgi:protein SCO1
MNEVALKIRGRSRVPKKPFRVWKFGAFWVSLLLIGVVMNGFLFFHNGLWTQPQETPYGQTLNPAKAAYDFHLTDQDGKPFRLSQLRGKVVLFSFGYTHCPDVCPTTLSDLAKVYRSLPAADRNRVQVLFISVDPQRDQPDALKKYMPYFDPAFIGLTGSASQIKEAAAAYGAAYTIVHPQGQRSDVYYVNHSPFTYLVSPNGKWRLRYLYTQLSGTEKVAEDVERCLASPDLP